MIIEKKKRYIPLDGLRGIAILGVFFVHFPLFPRVTRWGWAGVDLFFVLSGFLITGILFDNLASPRYFRDFYIRRSLRILPLFFAFWLHIAVLTPTLHFHWLKGYWAWVAYVGNFLPALAVHQGLDPNFYTNFEFVDHHGFRQTFVIGHLWTLCIEEQFYFLWPIIVWLVRDRRNLMKMCLVAISLCISARLILPMLLSDELRDSDLVVKLMPTHCEGLMFGAIIALWLRGQNDIRSLRLPWIYGIGAFSIIAILFSDHFSPGSASEMLLSPWIEQYGLTLIAIVSATFLIAALTSKTAMMLLSFRPLVALGEISYGFYILHWVPRAFVNPPVQSNLIRHGLVIFYFASTFAVSWMSFRFFERPFLKLKDRLAPATRSDGSVGGV